MVIKAVEIGEILEPLENKSVCTFERVCLQKKIEKEQSEIHQKTRGVWGSRINGITRKG
jgi:hypothetical protein